MPTWNIVANLLVALIALMQGYILLLEMFLWTHPASLRAFGDTKPLAEATRVLAATRGSL